MTTDITFCANPESCTIATICKRAQQGETELVWMANFSPEKGLQCEGFSQVAKLTHWRTNDIRREIRQGKCNSFCKSY